MLKLVALLTRCTTSPRFRSTLEKPLVATMALALALWPGVGFGQTVAVTGEVTPVTSGLPAPEWNVGEALYVSTISDGTVTVSAGGKLTSPEGAVGWSGVGNGKITITGTNSSYTTGKLIVGNRGQGVVEILSGGTMTTGSGTALGYYNGSTGTVSVSGAGSSWTGTGLSIGYEGNGVVTISDGGTVNSRATYIGATSTATGTVTVSGTNALWALTEIYVGNVGKGFLTISNGGEVRNSGRADIGPMSPAGNGSVTVQGEGSLWAVGGSLSIGRYGPADLTIQDGGMVTVSNNTTIYAGGTLTLDGGTLRTNAITRTGSLDFRSGTLITGGDVAGNWEIPELGTLGGTPTLLGDLTVDGTLAPGNSTGTLRVNGGLTLTETARVTMELASLADFDQITANGSLTLAGTLEIRFLDDFRPGVDDTFKLFNGTYTGPSGAFSAIEFTALGYQGAFNYETGTLSITAIPEPSTYALVITSAAAFLLLRRRSRMA